VALILATVVLFRMKRQKFAWVTMVPTAWLLVCTLTAGYQKLFHENPRIGFLAHADKFRAAAANGELLAPAKSAAQMQQIIMNDYIDASLAAIFMAVVLSILAFGIRACLQALREDQPTTVEAAATPANTVSA
jgi:carbon starvation protein